MNRHVLLSLLLLSACSSAREGTAQTTTARQPEFVGKIWLSSDPSAAPGTFRIFLADGSLVMDSCWETYRLAAWRRIDDRRIEWTEDTARIEAEIAEVTPQRLQLRLQLEAAIKEESYRPATVPMTCPDMPR